MKKEMQWQTIQFNQTHTHTKYKQKSNDEKTEIGPI